MNLFKKIFTFSAQNASLIGGMSPKSHVNSIKFIINSSQKTFLNSHVRCITFYPLAQNMQYLSKTPNLNIKVDKNTMKLNMELEKPLCYMFTWLNAKNHHIIKYAKIYLDKGFDIFNITCTPRQLLLPTVWTQPIIINVMKFMEQNTSYNPMVLQGFSVSSYMWGEVCKYASQDLPRYQPLLDKFVVQAWDSLPDMSEFRVGIAKGQFPHNPILQWITHNYAQFHLWAFYRIATVHYNKASEHFHGNLVTAPCLMLCSKTDPVGAMKSVWGYKTSWEKRGTKIEWKCFDDAPHTQLIHVYPDEYVKTVDNHLRKHLPMMNF